MTSGKRIDEADRRRIVRMAASGIGLRQICRTMSMDAKTVKRCMMPQVPEEVRLSSGVDKPSRRTT